MRGLALHKLNVSRCVASSVGMVISVSPVVLGWLYGCVGCVG
jgi:hypothetical protein